MKRRDGRDADDYQTAAGIPLQPFYRPESLAQQLPPFDEARDLAEPGQFPFTRGLHPTMYRGRLWTMRQYAGFGTAEESNRRYKFLLDAGQTGLSVAFDLPTQMGRDADHALSRGEVGRTGVSIGTVDDMRTLLDGLPLDRVSTSMTINATAATLLCLYVAVADERGVARSALQGTIQNDILKEYIARGTYIYPPGPSMRLVADTFAFCRDELPRWNTISISGYHIREAGSDAVQEVAFTLADGIAYVQAAVDRGLPVDEFAPRLSFFFNAHANLLEEVAKFRAARRLWARTMQQRFGAKDPRSLMLRFHAQTAGSTLTAQQPRNNIARTTIEALAAVLGGAQSVHTNGFDEALSLPTEAAAALALRTQQIIAHESGVPGVVDPLGGAYAVEALTTEIETRAAVLIAEIDRRGGMVAAIEQGFPQQEIERRAFEHQRAVEQEARIIVGQNAYTDESDAADATPLHHLDPALEKAQAARVERFRGTRDNSATTGALGALREAARGRENLLPRILAAVKARATLGEIADAFRDVFGEYRPVL
ncbi:MAG TPA: methylmalonyl-CoA mutase family protein [Polyangia bacterium]|jgi:methylmalonyl-CoA mutase N-terminal domain/subunit|nr:methylmalonyl-CoA mutase family protein [Polyangia bacterium]